MKANTVMMTDEMRGMLQSAGFSSNDDTELQGRLKIFAMLLVQYRTEQLMTMFEELAKAELQDCADQCRNAGHNAAADMLVARGKAFVVNADQMMIKHLQLRKQHD